MLGTLLSILRHVSRWLFWPSLALVVWGELTPNPPHIMSLVWDKAEHFIAYFGLAAMATFALGLGSRLAWAILFLINLGGALEVAQHFTGRDPEIMDLIANCLGVFAGLCAAAVFAALVERSDEEYLPPD